jgi:hypothetical protein
MDLLLFLLVSVAGGGVARLLLPMRMAQAWRVFRPRWVGYKQQWGTRRGDGKQPEDSHPSRRRLNNDPVPTLQRNLDCDRPTDQQQKQKQKQEAATDETATIIID